MQHVTIRFPFSLILLAALLAVAPAGAAVKEAKPEAPKALADLSAGSTSTSASTPTEDSGVFHQVGQVIFSRGSQVVAEIESGTVENEYLLVLDTSFRRKGAAVVVQPLKGGTFLLRGSGTSLAEGDRLARETELQATARVLQQNRAEDYLAFLARFPDSAYAPRIARELFRLQMKAEYPSRPGNSVGGTLVLGETANHPIPLENVRVLLDRFVVALTDGQGQYRIDGIPIPSHAVAVKLRIKDPKFQGEGQIVVTLPAGDRVDLSQNLPVHFTPTMLSGVVLDEDGVAMAGAEVWTAPYTTEFLTGEDGSFEISRRKDLNDPKEVDKPLFGGEYEVYARRTGYSVERVEVSAESFVANRVPTLRLAPQDTRNEPVPELSLTLRDHLRIDSAALFAQRGTGPLLNP